MCLHNLAPAAARPDRNFNFFFLVFLKLFNLDSMSVSPQLAAKEDGSILPNTIPDCIGLDCFGLVWFAMDWFGWYIYAMFLFIVRIVLSKPQLNPSSTLVECYTKMGHGMEWKETIHPRFELFLCLINIQRLTAGKNFTDR